MDCIVTSPPYWQLRDYGIKGQLGLERTLEEYTQRLCDVFDEVKRVLKSAGTCWVVLGDTYGSQGMNNRDFNGRGQREKLKSDTKAQTHRPRMGIGVAAKSLGSIPFRFAIEMVNRGWRLRNVIIWHKPNCLPSSAKDRFTVDFEYVFFFTKGSRYFFRRQFEPLSPSTVERVRSFRRNHESFDPARHKRNEAGGQTPFEVLASISRRGLNPRGRNKRCVWTIPVRGFRGAHFAVFPEPLVEILIQAGCPCKGLVCDPFCGTGTTGRVAHRLERRFVGIELNPRYVRLARKRLRSVFQKV